MTEAPVSAPPRGGVGESVERPDGAAKTVVERAPMCQFGTDLKNSADLREYKACGIHEGTVVAGELRSIRDRVHKRV